MKNRLSRRRFLTQAAGAVAAGAAGGTALGAMQGAARAVPTGSVANLAGDATTAAALQALGRTSLRLPGSRPEPGLPAGADLLPGIDHIVVLMLENHSFDNIFGMLGRGDGFTLGANGQPTATNPYPDGRLQHAFHMPTTCQLPSRPSQEWTASHNAYNTGRNDGFVSTPISKFTTEIVGGVAMGYWTGEDLPFTYSLAQTFPIGDRWFCSLLGQTDPNRRYLIAGTSAGMTDDIGFSVSLGEIVPDLSLPLPASGTIFNTLDLHRISWANYSDGSLTSVTPELYPVDDTLSELSKKRPFQQFYTDAAAGALPGFSLLDPNYSTESQENPQNIAVGEGVLAKVVNALGASPLWPRTLFILTYDEHGGYFDHVPPPPALAPDLIPPLVQPGEPVYDGFRRYGFRVPAVVVSAFAKRDYVSHALYDHTSVLAMVQRKWNLPSLTWRDANANDLRDFLDLTALAQGRPTFPTFPRLAPPGNTLAASACSTTGPGVVPPPGSITG